MNFDIENELMEAIKREYQDYAQRKEKQIYEFAMKLNFNYKCKEFFEAL